ncbi:MAG: energy-coupling factor ABC transporter permease [Baekduia sp.]
MIVISSVLIVQCFLFADGGIAALGANIFNMAVVGGVGGWALCRAIEKVGRGRGMRIAAAGIAAWFGTVLASIACAGELAASKTIEWRVVFPAMAGVHMLIGVGEGVITMLVLSAIAASRPDLIGESTIGPRAGEKRPGGGPGIVAHVRADHQHGTRVVCGAVRQPLAGWIGQIGGESGICGSRDIGAIDSNADTFV